MLQPLIAQAAETKERTGLFFGFLVTDFGAGATLAFDFGGGYGNAIALDGFLSLPIIGEPAVGVKLTGSARILLATHPKEAPPPAFNTLPGGAAHPDVVIGPDADGAAITKAPILVAGRGSAGGAQAGLVETAHVNPDGAATAGPNVLLVGGWDGANTHLFRTDGAGRPSTVGAAAAGAAPVGAPVLIAGSDGANVRSLLTDAAGRQIATGAAAHGAAIVGNPIPAAGRDAAGNGYILRTNSQGNQLVRSEASEIDDTTSGVGAAIAARTIDCTERKGLLILLTGAGGNPGTLTISYMRDDGSTQTIFTDIPAAAAVTIALGLGAAGATFNHAVQMPRRIQLAVAAVGGVTARLTTHGS